MSGYFNPRPPRGGRRPKWASGEQDDTDFNPRPPRGGRPQMDSAKTAAIRFQSTPPARGATAGIRAEQERQKFQSTPPARGATNRQGWWSCPENISIHAPREGGDHPPGRECRHSRVISIHAPREGGDDGTPYIVHATIEISIHAPREGGDVRQARL